MYMKKAVSVILLAAFCLVNFASPASAGNSVKFKDVPEGYWSKAEITDFAARGIIAGDGKGMFYPDEKVTREQFCKMFALAFGVPLKTPAESAFSDNAGGNWSYYYIESCTAYMNSYEDEYGGKPHFRVGNMENRENIATALVKIFELTDAADSDYVAKHISDSGDITPSLLRYVNIAVQNELISPLPDGSFCPQSGVTRAEAVVLLDRASKRIGGAMLGSEASFDLFARTGQEIDETSETALPNGFTENDSLVYRVRAEKGNKLALNVYVHNTGEQFAIRSATFDSLWSPEGGVIGGEKIKLKTVLPQKVPKNENTAVAYEIAIPTDVPNGVYRGVVKVVCNDIYKTFHEIRLEVTVVGNLKNDMVTLAQDGKTDWRLTTTTNPSPSQTFAAAEFIRLFKAVTGADITSAADTTASGIKTIVIGSVEDVSKFGEDGFNITVTPDRVTLSGAAKRGTLYAVYTFFEDYFGVKWLDSQSESIPSVKCAQLPCVNRTDIPTLKSREAFFPDSFKWEFAVRNKLNGHTTYDGVYFSAEHGGNYTYAASDFAHSMSRLLPTSEYYASHPEYFALYKGVRDSSADAQLCLTNPAVLKIVIAKVKERLKQDPDANYVSITQCDNNRFCQCDKCAAVDAEERSHAGTMIRFVNAVATAIKDEYPNVLVDTFAYTYTQKPPKLTKPASNVIIRLTSMNCCFSHTLNSNCDMAGHDYDKKPTGPANAQFTSDLKIWSSLANHLAIWDYVVNFGVTIAPHPNIYVLRDNIRTFVDNRVIGLFEQGEFQTAHGDCAELKAYILAKYMWNPDYPQELAINEFLTGYYGRASIPIRQYVDLVNRQPSLVTNVHFPAFSYPSKNFYTDQLVDESVRLMNKAQQFAEGDDVVSQRVCYVKVPVTFISLLMEPIQDATLRKAASEKFKSELIALGYGYLGAGLSVDKVPEYIEANRA